MKPRPGRVDVIVGRNVRSRREHLGLSQDDVAQAVRDRGWRASGVVLVALERGERAVRLSEAVVLADVLSVSVADLLDGVEVSRSAGDESMREAERHAARRLGIPAREVVRRSRDLWGCTLTDKRDAVAADRTPEDATKGQRALIRAHVTRGLLAELRAAA